MFAGMEYCAHEIPNCISWVIALQNWQKIFFQVVHTRAHLLSWRFGTLKKLVNCVVWKHQLLVGDRGWRKILWLFYTDATQQLSCLCIVPSVNEKYASPFCTCMGWLKIEHNLVEAPHFWHSFALVSHEILNQLVSICLIFTVTV